MKRGFFLVSPASQNIPEAIALAFSVSILYRLCKPFAVVDELYTSTQLKKFSPSFHKKAKGDNIPSRSVAAENRSTSVSTNNYLGHVGSYGLDASLL